MINSLILFLILEKRNNLSSIQIILFRVVSSLFNIVFLFFASKAYSPSNQYFDLTPSGTFEYILIGDLCLRLACDALMTFHQHTKLIIGNGIFDTLLNTKTSFFRIILNKGVSSLTYSIVFLLFELVILTLMTSFSFSFYPLLLAIVINLASLPLFISFGLLNSSLYIQLRRGSSLTGILTTLLSVTSGAYFPISVFPEGLGQMVKGMNPFYFLINKTRYILNFQGFSTTQFITDIIILSFIGLILLYLNAMLMRFVITLYKKKGSVLKVIR